MDKTIYQLGDFFSILSDPTRLKILVHLIEKPLSVNQIRQRLGEVTLAAVSYQLKNLYLHDFVRFEKVGRKKFFRLADKHIIHILNDSFNHITEDKLCDQDCEDYHHLQEVFTKK